MHKRKEIIELIKTAETSRGPFLSILDHNLKLVWHNNKVIADLYNIQKIGIFSSSFNPPTLAHQEMIFVSYSKFKLDRVIILFDLVNADKHYYPISLFDRILMTYLHFRQYSFIFFGLTNQPLFVNKLELVKKSFFKNAQIYFIVGSDTFVRILDTKYYQEPSKIEELFSESSWIVFSRPSTPSFIPSKYAGNKNIYFCNLPPRYAEISSTTVRDYVKENKSLSKLVPSCIEKYIKRNNLYQPSKTLYVVTGIIQYRGKVLLLKRSQKIGSFKGKYSGVSGIIELPEYLKYRKQPVKVYKRFSLNQVYTEIKEETGLVPEDLELVEKGPLVKAKNPVNKNQTFYIFPFLFQLKVSPKKIKLNWENSLYLWIKPEDIFKFPTVPRLPYVLMQFFIRPKILRKIMKIHHDNKSGAMELTKKTLMILEQDTPLEEYKVICKVLENIKPMAPIINVVKLHKKGMSIKEIIKKLKSSQEQLIEQSEKIIKEGDNIVSYSYSSTLFSIFSRQRKVVIWLPNEIHSNRLAKKLSSYGVRVKSFDFSDGLPPANKIIISCDAFFEDGSILNAKGTSHILKQARSQNIQVYCFASKFKKISKKKIMSLLENHLSTFEIISRHYIDYLIVR